MIGHAVLLEGPVPGNILTAVFLFLPGVLGFWQGWIAYTETTPHFVIDYRGWTCPPLALFYGGAAMLLMSLGALKPPLSRITGGIIGLSWLFCGLTFLIGYFIWSPPFPPSEVVSPGRQGRRGTQ